MTLIDQSIARVRRAVRRAPSKNAFANAAGLAESFLRDVFNGHWNPTAATLRKLEGAAPAFEPDNSPEGDNPHRVHGRVGPDHPGRVEPGHPGRVGPGRPGKRPRS